jgi:exodeoxyribonuclease VII large subunit
MSQTSLDLDLGDEGLPTLTVRELAEAINQSLRRGFFEGVWVRGEVQGLSERNGHLYFTLADDGEDGRATVSVSLFANVRVKLRPLLQRHRLRLADGMRVRIHGFPDFFPPTGRLTLKMSGIDPRYTLGELALQREDLVRRLVAEDLYDAQSRLTLPALPLTVGLVTSVASAAWHDVVDELERSRFGFHVLACDARVQGEWAAEMVAAAITTLADVQPDVIVVVRGGGARSDLAAFDTERVARAIGGCPVPVLTGLGHEIDRSIADEVAHLALKTPTACAGVLVARVQAFKERAEGAWSAIVEQAGATLGAASEALVHRAARASERTRSGLALAEHRLDQRAERLPFAAGRVLAVRQATVARVAGRVGADSRHHLRAGGLTLDGLEARVRALDPVHTLARGWSITRTADGRVVRSVAEVGPGDTITTTLADGQARSRVEETTPT